MWQIIKAEMKYYRVAFTAPIFYTILSQAGEIFYLKTMLGMENVIQNNESIRIDGFYFFVLIFSLFSIWQTRHREKRDIFFTKLPLTSKQLAVSRFWLGIIPFGILIMYFVSSYFIVKYFWNVELSVIIIKLIASFFVVFSGYIRVSDEWFSHSSFRERIQSRFIVVLIIQSLLVATLFILHSFYAKSIPIFNKYEGVLFLLLGIIIMLTTIPSYIKRKSYLS